jgi:hypothetical protein
MRPVYRYLGPIVLSLAILAALGCGPHRVRVYDSYHNDYHRWNNHETVYYQQWETDGHRDHREFNQRNKDEQKQYWDWRHQHDHH